MAVRQLGSLLFVLLCGTFVAAGSSDCARYAHDGVALTMDRREVRKNLRGRDLLQGTIGHGESARSVERFGDPSVSVRVYYDRRVTKRSDARVIALDIEFAETDGTIPEAMGLFVDGLGRPTSGADHLSRGLETGVVQWNDPECDVRVEAYRREPEWWEPSGTARFHVRIESVVAHALEATVRE